MQIYYILYRHKLLYEFVLYIFVLLNATRHTARANTCNNNKKKNNIENKNNVKYKS